MFKGKTRRIIQEMKTTGGFPGGALLLCSIFDLGRVAPPGHTCLPCSLSILRIGRRRQRMECARDFSRR